MSGRRASGRPRRGKRNTTPKEPTRSVTSPPDDVDELRRELAAARLQLATRDLGDPDASTVITDDGGEEHAYTLTLLDADLGVELQGRLGAAWGQLTAVAGELFAGDGSFSGQSLAGAVTGTLRQLLIEEGAELFLDLLSGCTRDGQPIDEVTFKRVYAGNYGEMYLAAWWVFVENFGGIAKRHPFAQLLAKLKEVARLRLSESSPDSPKTSSAATPSSASPGSSGSTRGASDGSGS